MTTWTPKTQQVETWIGEPAQPRVFSTRSFSKASFLGFRVFATEGKNALSAWAERSKAAETWTVEA